MTTDRFIDILSQARNDTRGRDKEMILGRKDNISYLHCLTPIMVGERESILKTSDGANLRHSVYGRVFTDCIFMTKNRNK